MLNLIVWNGIVFDIENLVTLNWIVLYKTFLKFNWIRTVWINWIAWNRNAFDNWIVLNN